MTINYEVNQTW